MKVERLSVFQATGLFCPVASDADLCGTFDTMTETDHSVNVTSVVTHTYTLLAADVSPQLNWSALWLEKEGCDPCECPKVVFVSRLVTCVN